MGHKEGVLRQLISGQTALLLPFGNHALHNEEICVHIERQEYVIIPACWQ